MNRALTAAFAALLGGLALLLAACGGGGSKDAVGPDESYPEGKVRLGVETLDTGLLKGNAFVEAAEGWTVSGIKVKAVDYKGITWPVLEFPEGVPGDQVKEFFEVAIQELPRSQQVTVTVTAFFLDENGNRMDRTAEDHWPP